MILNLNNAFKIIQNKIIHREKRKQKSHLIDLTMTELVKYSAVFLLISILVACGNGHKNEDSTLVVKSIPIPELSSLQNDVVVTVKIGNQECTLSLTNENRLSGICENFALGTYDYSVDYYYKVNNILLADAKGSLTFIAGERTVLDITNLRLDHDLDDDGFSNLQEIISHTNPQEKNSVPQEVASISIDKAINDFIEGKTHQLTWKISDLQGNDFNEAPLQWTSSNENVATVDSSGLISFLVSGSATITLKDPFSDKLDTIDIVVTAEKSNDEPDIIIDNKAPVFNTPTSTSHKENTTVITTISASDENDDELTYSISSGDDANLFTIDNRTGELSFVTSPDYENPIDLNTDNVYQLVIDVNDKTVATSLNYSITVIDVVQTPNIIISPMDGIDFGDNRFEVKFSLDRNDCNIDQNRMVNCGEFNLTEHSYALEYSHIDSGNSFATASGTFTILEDQVEAPVLNPLIYTSDYDAFIFPDELNTIVIQNEIRVGENTTFTVELKESEQSRIAIAIDDNSLQCAIEDNSFVTLDGASLSATKEGTTNLNCLYGELSCSTPITILPAILQSINLDSPTPSLIAGEELIINASGNYSDETVKNINAEVVWLSGDDAIFEVVIVNSDVKLIGKSEGSAKLSVSLNGITTEVSVNVTANDKVLAKLYIHPHDVKMVANSKESLRVVGIYTNNTSEDLTNQVSWRSMDDSIISVSNEAGSNGSIAALTEGQTILEASLNGISHGIPTTVFESSIKSIDISLHHTLRSPEDTFAVGTSFRYKAIATFTDDSTQDITQSASWGSTDHTVFTAFNMDKGKVTAIGEGTGLITASFSNKVGVIVLKAINSQLDSIFFTYNEPLMPIGLEADNQISTNFSIASVLREIRENVLWSSSDTNVAEVDTNGIVTAKNVGTTKITASLLSKTAQYDLTVDNSKPSTSNIVTVLDIPAMDVGIGRTQALAVRSTYDNGEEYDISDQATWIVEDDTLAAITTLGSTIGSRGVVSGLIAGETQIKAHFFGETVSELLIVKNEDCGSGALAISNLELPIGLDTDSLLEAEMTGKVSYTGEYSQLTKPGIALQFDMGEILFSSVKALPSPYSKDCTLEFSVSIPSGLEIEQATGVDTFVTDGVQGTFSLNFRILDDAISVDDQWNDSPGSNIVNQDVVMF